MLQMLFNDNCMPEETAREPPKKKKRTVGGKKNSLQCKEHIDWEALQGQEPVSGSFRVAAQSHPFAPPFSLPEWASLEIDSRDVKAINELGKMSLSKMDDYIRKVMTDAYVTEYEEANEFKVARLLNIFPKTP